MESPEETTGLPFGFINVCKPAGVTSTKMGMEVKYLLHQRLGGVGKKPRFGLGHLGTLDPDAQGVLPLAVGKATRLLPYCTDRTKVYRFTLVLGAMRASGDDSGDIVARRLPQTDAGMRLRAVLPSFHGRLQQIPPMLSALHHQGRRLYEYAREGVVIERPAREYEIFSLTWLDEQTILPPYDAEYQRYHLRVHCSEGTYIRSLCEDLAEAVGELGYMEGLFREAAGPFHSKTAVSLADIMRDPNQVLLDPRSVIVLPEIVLSTDERQKFCHGQTLVSAGRAVDCEACYVVFDNTILGVASVQAGLLRPKCVLV